MTKEAALKAFFKRFEGEQVRQGTEGTETVTWRSFPDTAVKAGTPLPYLSYRVPIGGYPDVVSGEIKLWDNATQESPINAKAREIFEALGRTGIKVPCDNGTIWIMRDNNGWNHTNIEDEPEGKMWFLNIEVAYHTID